MKAPKCDLCHQRMLWQDEDADGPTAQWVCLCNGGYYLSPAEAVDRLRKEMGVKAF